MLIVHCPVCGVEGDETDFHCGGQAHIARPATSEPSNIADAAQRDYLFMRFNPKGLHFERWRCDRGCGKWFHAARDTVTQEFKAYYGITELPPGDVIKQATGQWAKFFEQATAGKPAARKVTGQKTTTKQAAAKKPAARKSVPAKAKKS